MRRLLNVFPVEALLVALQPELQEGVLPSRPPAGRGEPRVATTLVQNSGQNGVWVVQNLEQESRVKPLPAARLCFEQLADIKLPLAGTSFSARTTVKARASPSCLRPGAGPAHRAGGVLRGGSW